MVLARLLSPDLFGVMLIVNTVRTGVDLLSDVGIGQNIVSNKDGHLPGFYSTAWTLQIIRGLLLSVIFSSAAIPISRIYGEPALSYIIPISSLYFIFSGLEPPSRFIFQKRMQVDRLSVLEVSVFATLSLFQIILAILWPTVWALVYGGVMSSIILTTVSYIMLPVPNPKLMIDLVYARRILSFGKWIFLSTSVYFFASNLDRLYMGRYVPLALLGVYGVARSLSDILSQLAVKLTQGIVFPMVAASELDHDAMRTKVNSAKSKFLPLAAIGTSVFAASSGLIVDLLYDDRYRTAALFLPILTLGIWFGVLASLGEALMLGIRRPGYGAMGNTAKLVWLSVTLPVSFQYSGLIGALWSLVISDIGRYLILAAGQVKTNLSSWRQEILATFLFVIIFLALRLVIWGCGFDEFGTFLPLPTSIE